MSANIAEAYSNIRAIYVSRAKENLSFVCLHYEQEFKCGRCQRGNIKPQIGHHCKVCRARVHQIAYFLLGAKP